MMKGKKVSIYLDEITLDILRMEAREGESFSGQICRMITDQYIVKTVTERTIVRKRDGIGETIITQK